ncbi:O-methyltransferase [Floridanema evergladense]|uniref:O-methyltransferase n=1 Tax=Floridaenema evergladense BLCC-F167 TaxID=3153639 RepID=A0ABV4WKH5_9CYAN
MAGSYSKINYRLRPAKAVERKMICDSLRCLSPFGELTSYRYVGFGSTYFSDFILFHKSLHIEDMISIEKDQHAKERFEYNKPFGCIKIKYGASYEVLPTIEWNKKSIVWLDYDSPLEKTILDDIDTLIGKLVSGSVLIVTVSAEPERPGEEGLTIEQIAQFREDKLQERLPKEKIPINLESIDLTGKRLGNLYKRIIHNQIEQSIITINSTRSADEKLNYKQIFDFRYADGSRMLTIGWLLFEHSYCNLAEQCKFNKNFQVTKLDEPYEINVPNLTLKEIQYLDSQMPTDDCNAVQRICIPLKDVKSYAELYKYFPSFVEMFM